MPLALSTHWNAHEHTSGEALVDEALSLGFQHLELGYDLRMDLVPGVRQRVADGSIRIDSVHNFCPIPPMSPMGHPELHSLGAPDERERKRAVFQTLKTVEFAAEVGARCVVVHAGTVRMRLATRQLIEMAGSGKLFTPRFDRLRRKLTVARERKAPRHLDALRRSLDELLPQLQQAGIAIGIENLPYWEYVPSHPEMLDLFEAYSQPELGYWHDVGHGQIMQDLGFIGVQLWLERLQPWLKGFHLHDVVPPANDHMPPGMGAVDFTALAPFLDSNCLQVVELAPGTPPDALSAGVQHLAQTMGTST